MPYELHTDASRGQLDVLYSGVISAAELHEASRAAAQVVNESGILRVVADLTGVVRISATLTPVLELPQTIYVEEKLSRRLRIAVLVPPDDDINELARFYELVCHNRGWLAKIFADRDEALGWLHGGSS
jgi:hypothetical protein